MRNADALQTIAKVTTLVAALWAAPLHAQVVSLSPNQVIALAADAIRDERPGDAVVAMDAYLRQIPDDPSALLIRTEAAILTGDFPGAVSFGQKAFWNAASNGQRYSASRLIALGHARQMQDSRAQLWLRAARQFAPNEAASESVARDFVAIRQRNPLSTSLRFGISPSDNVNNGTKLEDLGLLGQVFTLSEDAQPLDGLEFNARATLRYRLRTAATSATFFDLGISGETFRLSEEAQERVDNDPRSVDVTTGSDLSNATLNAGLTHRFVLGPDMGVTEASLSFARTFRKESDERWFATASASQDFNISKKDKLTLSGFLQRSEKVADNTPSQLAGLTATYSRTEERLGTFSFGLSKTKGISSVAREDYDAVSYRVGYATGTFAEAFSLGINMSFEQRDYATDPLFGPREDEIGRLGIRAAVTEVEAFGFQPVIAVDWSQTKSNIEFYDRELSTTFSFDIVSSF